MRNNSSSIKGHSVVSHEERHSIRTGFLVKEIEPFKKRMGGAKGVSIRRGTLQPAMSLGAKWRPIYEM
jgi:hypothetical protein